MHPLLDMRPLLLNLERFRSLRQPPSPNPHAVRLWCLVFGVWALRVALHPLKAERACAARTVGGLGFEEQGWSFGQVGYLMCGSGFRVLGWVLGFGFWVLGFGFWVLGLGVWVLGFGFWVLGFSFGGGGVVFRS